MPPLEITVFSTPAPQGSKSFKGIKGGKGIMIESSKRVAPWRQAVVYAAREAMNGEALMMSGPLEVVMVFTFPRPKSAKKNARPDKRPDLSKCVRSTEDALVDAGAIEDDARIVTCRSRKVYPGTHPDALNVPGCVIRIAEVKE